MSFLIRARVSQARMKRLGASLSDEPRREKRVHSYDWLRSSAFKRNLAQRGSVRQLKEGPDGQSFVLGPLLSLGYVDLLTLVRRCLLCAVRCALEFVVEYNSGNVWPIGMTVQHIARSTALAVRIDVGLHMCVGE